MLTASYAASSCSHPTASPQQTLRVVIDTIIPKDDHPGALDLELDQRLLKIISNNPDRHAALLDFATRLNSSTVGQNRSPFASQSLDQRESTLLDILEHGERADKQALIRIRSYILNWYYSSEVGHKSLGYIPPNRYRVTGQ